VTDRCRTGPRTAGGKTRQRDSAGQIAGKPEPPESQTVEIARGERIACAGDVL
jgi:hypothetical protein